jgi:1-deoxy-D-xylulose-5-phosphate reductoisomerase
MGEPDMATPIASAMAYPERVKSGVSPLDFSRLSELTFLEPDYSRYPCLRLAIDACFEGQHITTALNAANEINVDAFLKRQLGFTDIARINEMVMSKVCATDSYSEPLGLESLLEVDKMAREMTHQILRERRA